MNDQKEQLETLLSDYVDGNLRGDELKAVETYLDANPGIRDAVNRLMIDSEAIRSLPRVTAPIDFSEEVRNQAERDLLLDDAYPNHGGRRRMSTLATSIAAMLVIFLGMAGGAYWILSNRPAPFIDYASTAGTNGGGGVNLPVEEADTKETDAIAAATPMRDTEAARSAVAAPGEVMESARAKTDSFITKSETLVAMPPVLTISELPAPRDVAELVEDAPRSAGRAVVLVIEPDDAIPAQTAMQMFFDSNAVPATALGYDAMRKRAVLREEEGLANAAARQQTPEAQTSQVSGVISNAGPSSVGQMMDQQGVRFAVADDSPQVVLARGLTAEQTATLQQQFRNQLGDREATMYELDDGALGRLLTPNVATPSVDSTRDEAGVMPDTSASQPTLLAIGERLKLTLVDPDASNLKTVQELTIDEAGTIRLPALAEPIKASEMTLAALRRSIVDLYTSQGLMKNPIVDLELVGGSSTTRPGASATDATADSDGQKDKPLTPAEPATAAIEPRTDGAREADGRFDPTVDDRRAGDLLDVFVVVRGRSPATQPAAGETSTESPAEESTEATVTPESPTTAPTTRPN